MTSANSNKISIALIGAGALVWAFAGKPVVTDKNLDVELNPFGINRSPYGEVFAMAMQGPIDTFWNRGATTRLPEKNKPAKVPACGDASCATESCPHPAALPANPGVKVLFRRYLEELDQVSTARTNNEPATAAHKFYVRRQIEDKLKFAYQMDPSNYANYNSYHFFLTEPQMGTRPELTPGAAKLAEETIHYCLREQNDPRPALTAAAAATNIIHLMFNDRQQGKNRFSTAQMRQYLNLLDHCIQRYNVQSVAWEASGQKALLSPMRISEMEDRISFVRKIRDAAEGAIIRFENTPATPHVSN